MRILHTTQRLFGGVWIEPGERMAEVQVGPLAGFLLVGHQHGEAVSIGMLAAAWDAIRK